MNSKLFILKMGIFPLAEISRLFFRRSRQGASKGCIRQHKEGPDHLRT